MARITFSGLWEVPAIQNRTVRLLRGGADRIEVVLANQGLNGVTYTIQDITVWASRMDGIMGAIPAAETQMSIALGALDYIPMHDGLYTNGGTRGGVATLMAGVLVNNNPYFGTEGNATFQQLANGYIRLASAGTFCTYNGPFAFGMWIYPTLVSALAPIYTEQNAGVTHYMQIFLDTDRRIGFRMNNGVSSFSVKDPTGPQVPLNQWSLIFCKYSAPNFTYFVTPNNASAVVSVGAGGLDTFVDATGTFIGITATGGSGMNGYIGGPFTFNNATYNGQTTAPLSPAMQEYLYYEWQGAAFGFALPLDSAALSGGASFQKTYGKGTGNPLPSVMGVHIDGSAGDTRLYVRLMLERDE